MAMLRKLTIALLAIACVSAGSVTYASSDHPSVIKVVLATARYRKLDNALAAQYHLLTDAQGVECIDMPGMGAMGVHYVRDDLVGNDTVDGAANLRVINLRFSALVFAFG